MRPTRATTQSRAEQDTKMLKRVQKRLTKAFRKLKTWRKVAAEKGINHGHISLVMQGNIPRSKEIRKALGFPAVMPSERRAYVKKVYPLIGADGWEEVYFKKIKGRKTRGVK